MIAGRITSGASRSKTARPAHAIGHQDLDQVVTDRWKRNPDSVPFWPSHRNLAAPSHATQAAAHPGHAFRQHGDILTRCAGRVAVRRHQQAGVLRRPR